MTPRTIIAMIMIGSGLASPAWADWIKPSTCTGDPTGWDEYDAPVVVAWDVSNPDRQKELAIESVEFNQYGAGKAKIIPGSYTSAMRIDVNYTPFLNGYHSYTMFPEDNIYDLPPPGFSSWAVLDQVTFTVLDSDGTTIGSDAFVMFTPDFSGSSPYYMQANAQGQLTISCFQVYPGGNFAYVTGADDTSKGSNATVTVGIGGTGTIRLNDN